MSYRMWLYAALMAIGCTLMLWGCAASAARDYPDIPSRYFRAPPASYSPPIDHPGSNDLEGKTVRRIVFVGLKQLDSAAVKTLMETQEGKAFRREKIERDIKTLIDKDAFVFIPWVKAELTPDGKGVVVTLDASDSESIRGPVIRFDPPLNVRKR